MTPGAPRSLLYWIIFAIAVAVILAIAWRAL